MCTGPLVQCRGRSRDRKNMKWPRDKSPDLSSDTSELVLSRPYTHKLKCVPEKLLVVLGYLLIFVLRETFTTLSKVICSNED